MYLQGKQEKGKTMCDYCDRNGQESYLYYYESDVIFDDESKIRESSELLYDEEDGGIIENVFSRDGRVSRFEIEINYCPMCGRKL